MKRYDEHNDPRFRILHHPETATLEDIIAVLLSHGTGKYSVRELSARIAGIAGDESGLFSLDSGQISAIAGIKRARAASLLAAIELGRRKNQRDVVRKGNAYTPSECAAWIFSRLRGLEEEQFYLMSFNRRQMHISFELLERGSDDNVSVCLRKIIKKLLNDRARYALVAHNHPDGTAMASYHDGLLLHKLDEVLPELGLSLLDQFIVGLEGVYSHRLERFILQV